MMNAGGRGGGGCKILGKRHTRFGILWNSKEGRESIIFVVVSCGQFHLCGTLAENQTIWLKLF